MGETLALLFICALTGLVFWHISTLPVAKKDSKDKEKDHSTHTENP